MALYTVTGGAGFIGSHLAAALVAAGARVRVVDNLSSGRRENLAGLAVDFVEGDVRDPDVAARAAEGAEGIFHLAAMPSVPRSWAEPEASHAHNATATLGLLRAAERAGVRRLVFSSSSSVYGDTPVLPKVEATEPLPRSPYAVAKLAAEQYTLAFARTGRVEGVALRYFNIFGPRQRADHAYAAVIPKIMDAIVRGVPFPRHGDGEQTRDFTYVDNAVSANLLAMRGPASRVSGAVVNVGAGARTSLNTVIRMVEELTGERAEIQAGPTRDGDVRDSLAGLERARAVLGYEPLVDLESGIRHTWAAWER